ncbi:MAG TPA: universal stress protein [Candidatus Limnocylindrales bacterium]
MNETITTPYRVLLATDDSDAARNAEAWVSRLRWSRPCVVDVLCVAGHGITRFGWGMQTYRTTVRQAVEQIRQSELLAGERVANAVGERLQRAGLTVHAWARQGDAAEEILAMIDQERPDVIALGPRGRSGLAELLLGSVSHQIVVSSTLPALIARRPPSEQGPLPEHLLVLVDGSLAAKTAIGWIARTGWAVGAKVTVLGLLGVPPGVDTDEPEAVSGLGELVRGDAATSLDTLSEPLREQAESLTIELDLGHPLEGAFRAAKQTGADLVVMARPPRRRGQDPFAEKVARYASNSVLIVPAT